MKKFRNIFLSCMLVILTLLLSACTQKFTVTFVNVDGTVLKTEEVVSGAAATAPADPSYNGLDFLKWNADFSAVTSDLTVEAVFFGVNEANKLKVDFNYTGKNFERDGVGEVRLNRVVDGDTISVYSGSYQAITIRFLGIDTPESTGAIQAWGKASSAYAKEILYAAHSILLEAEGEERMDSNGKDG